MEEGATALQIDPEMNPKRKFKKTIPVNNEEPLQGPRTPRHLPRLRAHCRHGVRPCPYVTCKYNLYLDVSHAGSIMPNFPEVEAGEHIGGESCVLDVAERNPDGLTLEKVGELFNLTRERIRQVEAKAIIKFRLGVIKQIGSNWKEVLVPGPTDDGATFRSMLAVMEGGEGS